MQPTRSVIRKKYGLEEAPYPDLLSTALLCCFTTCQEAAEIEVRISTSYLDNGITLKSKVWRLLYTLYKDNLLLITFEEGEYFEG